MNAPLVIPTEKDPIILRQLTLEDAPAYFAAVDANREHLSQFGDETADKYPTLGSVEESLLNPANPDKLRLGIWDGDIFVGSINATPDDEGTEIGYWLDSRYTGQGYATFATKALGQYAQGHFGRVFANVVEGNTASERVLERAGFRRTAQEAGKLTFELLVPEAEAAKSPNLARRIAGSFIAGIRFVGRQLATSDQNPHEGRLRGSRMPSKYMHIPDYPPTHDDTV